MGAIKCYRCRDVGTPEGCSKCGKTSVPSYTRVQEEIGPVDEKLIPKFYQETMFNKEELLGCHMDLVNDPMYVKYVNTLDVLLKRAAGGTLPDKSALIISPKRYGKTIWAYSMMRCLSNVGMSIFPLLDTQQIKRFLTLAVEKPKTEYIRGLSYSYEDFINTDFLVMSVVKDNNRFSAYEVCDQVLDMRSRNGKVTIILSEFDVGTITYYDKTDRFSDLLKPQPSSDRLRYPGVLRYSKSLCAN